MHNCWQECTVWGTKSTCFFLLHPNWKVRVKLATCILVVTDPMNDHHAIQVSKSALQEQLFREGIKASVINAIRIADCTWWQQILPVHWLKVWQGVLQNWIWIFLWRSQIYSWPVMLSFYLSKQRPTLYHYPWMHERMVMHLIWFQWSNNIINCYSSQILALSKCHSLLIHI